MPPRRRRELDDAALAEERRLACLASHHLAAPVTVVQAGSGQIAYTNASWNTLFGYRAQEAVGRHISAVHRLVEESSPGDQLREMMRRLDRSGWWSGRLAGVGSNGAQFWCTVLISQVTDDAAGQLWVSVYLPSDN
jgi:PAS domain S-box-containing protein